jgi:hypothetical protein
VFQKERGIMVWFQEWWQNLGLVGQIMACAAIPMTVIMFLQLILMIIGGGFGGESDNDVGGDGHELDHGMDHGFDHGLDHGMDHSFDHGMDHDIDHSFDHSFDHGIDHGFDHGFDHGHDHGFGHDHDHDHGFEHDPEYGSGLHVHDGSHDSHSHLHIGRIFTVRGIVAFFAIGGWAGLAALSGGIPALWSIQISLLSGAAAMWLASAVINFALKMQSSGNINLRNALSQIADVYITIPPTRSNSGKVTMVLQERFVEIDAMTDSETEIRPDTKVIVIGLEGTDCLIVRPVDELNDQ